MDLICHTLVIFTLHRNLQNIAKLMIQTNKDGLLATADKEIRFEIPLL